MSRKTALFLVAACTAMLTFTRAVSGSSGFQFSGTVKDSLTEQPLQGVAVIASMYLDKQYYEAVSLTDQTGAFGLTVGVDRPAERIGARGPGVSLTGNSLVFDGGVVGGTEISLYDNRGRTLYRELFTSSFTGSRSIGLPEAAPGHYVLSVVSGGSRHSFPKLLTGSDRLTIRSGSVAPSAVRMTAKAKSSPDLNPVAVMLRGYYTKVVEVTEGQADMQILLASSGQWQGDGNKEYEGGMVKVKAKGCGFSMGQPIQLLNRAAADIWDLEVPVHRVSFTYDYWMDTTEVTQKSYSTVMSAAFPDFTVPTWDATHGLGDNIAAYSVNKYDAMLYCNARSKAEGLDTVYFYTGRSERPGNLSKLEGVEIDCSQNGYRLPTEAEWEYTCRGGAVTDFFWDKNFRPYPATPEDTAEISRYVLWRANAFSVDPQNYGVRQGVASKLPNAYGLFDMLGSLGEWYHAVYIDYPDGPQVDPKPTLNSSDEDIYSRGGNWGNNAEYIRNSTRATSFPNYEFFFLGFRTVKEVL